MKSKHINYIFNEWQRVSQHSCCTMLDFYTINHSPSNCPYMAYGMFDEWMNEWMTYNDNNSILSYITITMIKSFLFFIWSMCAYSAYAWILYFHLNVKFQPNGLNTFRCCRLCRFPLLQFYYNGVVSLVQKKNKQQQ